jgi:hypothetical protein
MNLCHFNLCFTWLCIGWTTDDERLARTTDDDDGRAHDGLNDGRTAGNLFFNAAEIIQKQNKE